MSGVLILKNILVAFLDAFNGRFNRETFKSVIGGKEYSIYELEDKYGNNTITSMVVRTNGEYGVIVWVTLAVPLNGSVTCRLEFINPNEFILELFNIMRENKLDLTINYVDAQSITSEQTQD